MNCCLPQRTKKNIKKSTRRPNQSIGYEKCINQSRSSTFDDVSNHKQQIIDSLLFQSFQKTKKVPTIIFSKVPKDQIKNEEIFINISTQRQPGDLKFEGKVHKINISVFGSSIPELQKCQSEFSSFEQETQKPVSNINKKSLNTIMLSIDKKSTQEQMFPIKGCIYKCNPCKLRQQQ